jgi:hypothetical protein
MARDTLQALLRLRRLAHDEARRALSAAVAQEALALAAADATEREIARETELACRLEADDAAVEAFGVWLVEARRRAEATRDAAERAEAETARARATLNLARAGLESAEAVAAERAGLVAKAEARREQHALDELTRRREP